MLILENISFRYAGQDDVLFSNVNFSIPSGQCLALTGASGVGKSTLANIVAGYYLPKSGRVLLDGIQITGKPNADVILLNQDDDLFPWQTALNHLRFVLQSLNRNVDVAIDYLHLVGLEYARDLYPNQLSGGMKKRLSIARVLAIDPKLLILDETFTYLDNKNEFSIAQILKHHIQKKNSSIMLISHDNDLINFMAQKRFPLDFSEANN